MKNAQLRFEFVIIFFVTYVEIRVLTTMLEKFMILQAIKTCIELFVYWTNLI